MPKVTVAILPFRKPEIIPPVFDAIFAQTHQDLEVIAVINDSFDGSKELIQSKYPKVKLIEPGYNSMFAIGNNLAFKAATGEFVQLVNDDLILEPDYIENMLKAFDDPKVAAATGKLLRYDFATNTKLNIIDTTGVTMSKSGRGKDRGQLEEDHGQYDNHREVFAVSGAAPMYRKSALEKVKYCENGKCEYYDEDFKFLWEDIDLSWRFNRAGFKNVYVPEAVGYHGRSSGQSKGGYLHVFHYVKHHSKFSKFIRQQNYKNHILMYLKNTDYIHPAFIFRELAMLGYILVLETSTLGIVPEIVRLIPKIRKKRIA